MAIRRRRSLLGDLLNLDKQLGNMFPGDFGEGETSVSDWSPRMDVYERDDELVFECEAPGLDKDDIEVSVDNNRLTIQGERRTEREVEEEERNYFRTERFYGSFQRSFALPENIDQSEITAEFSDGVLNVTLPKAEEEEAQQKIEIQ